MTREETMKIINGMIHAFPSYKPDSLSRTVDLWASMFADYPYKAVGAALSAYIATNRNGFAPSIGQIMGIIHDENTEEISTNEAWAMVVKAIRNSNYHAKEEFEKLPEAIQRAVGSHTNLEAWAALPSSTVHSVTQSQFISAYKAVAEREKHEAQIPEKVRMLLKQAAPMIEAK